MANVVVLLFRVRPEVFCVFPPPIPPGEKRPSASACQASWRYVMIVRCGAIEVNRPYAIGLLAIALFSVISCTTISHHEFSEPAVGWQIKSGQLMYRAPDTTLIGEVLVRFSKTGDFELTVSKGPGITLLSLRQDATFAEVKGGLAGHGWSGPVAQAPSQLRGWLGLRDQFLHTSNQKTVKSEER